MEPSAKDKLPSQTLSHRHVLSTALRNTVSFSKTTFNNRSSKNISARVPLSSINTNSRLVGNNIKQNSNVKHKSVTQTKSLKKTFEKFLEANRQKGVKQQVVIPEEKEEEDDSDVEVSVPKPLFKYYDEAEEAYVKKVKEEREIKDVDNHYNSHDTQGMDLVSENFNYLFYLEGKYRLSKEYLAPMVVEQIPSRATRSNKLVTERMRTILLDWLINCSSKLELTKETIFLGITILDKFIDVCNSPTPRRDYNKKYPSTPKNKDHQLDFVTKQNLQLVGLTAFVIAAKYEEVTFPVLEDWRWLSDGSVTLTQIIETELKMLRTLNFEVCMPSALWFLRRLSTIAQIKAKIHIMAKYFLESTIYCQHLAQELPSKKAAAAMYLSLELNNDGKTDSWDKNLEFYSRYNSKDLHRTIQLLCKLLVKTIKTCHDKTIDRSRLTGTAVFSKYCRQEENISNDKLIFTRHPGSVVMFSKVILRYLE